jgi:methanethiol oxidase
LELCRFYRKEDGQWAAEKVIDVPSWNVEGWALPQMPGIITDILISMDDRFLYVSNWVQGDIRQYDITDPSRPVQTGQIYIGGSAVQGSSVSIKDPDVKAVRKQLIVPVIHCARLKDFFFSRHL